MRLPLTLAIALLLAAPAMAQTPSRSTLPPDDEISRNPADIAAGRKLVEHKCSGCHAIGPHDRSHHPDAPPLRTLSQNYDIAGLSEAFAEGIIVGHPDMPEFMFEPGDIRALLAYMQSIQAPKTHPVPHGGKAVGTS